MSSAFYYGEVRKLVKAAELLGHSVVGTFHSHPFSYAIPGENDIKDAEEDSLMLIFDCDLRNARLWHIHKRRAIELKFKIK